MYLEFVLLGVTLASGGYAALLVWRKVPLLLQVPQQLIEQSFVTRPSRLKHTLEAAVAFIREERYYDVFYTVALALLGWARLRLLRLERAVFHFSSMLDARRHATGGDQQRYWDELKKDRREAENIVPNVSHEQAAVTVIAATMPQEQIVIPEAESTARHGMDSVSARRAPRAKPKPRLAGRSIPPRKGISGENSAPPAVTPY